MQAETLRLLFGYREKCSVCTCVYMCVVCVCACVQMHVCRPRWVFMHLEEIDVYHAGPPSASAASHCADTDLSPQQQSCVTLHDNVVTRRRSRKKQREIPYVEDPDAVCTCSTSKPSEKFSFSLFFFPPWNIPGEHLSFRVTLLERETGRKMGLDYGRRSLARVAEEFFDKEIATGTTALITEPLSPTPTHLQKQWLLF